VWSITAVLPHRDKSCCSYLTWILWILHVFVWVTDGTSGLNALSNSTLIFIFSSLLIGFKTL
jgi:hypothetical protein